MSDTTTTPTRTAEPVMTAAGVLAALQVLLGSGAALALLHLNEEQAAGILAAAAFLLTIGTLVYGLVVRGKVTPVPAPAAPAVYAGEHLAASQTVALDDVELGVPVQTDNRTRPGDGPQPPTWRVPVSELDDVDDPVLEGDAELVADVFPAPSAGATAAPTTPTGGPTA